MIQLTRKGAVFTGTAADLHALRAQFDRFDYVILPKLIEPDLLHTVVRQIESAKFLPLNHGGIGVEHCMADRLTTGLLTFLANSPKFLRLIEEITGCRTVGEFTGRVYRMTSSKSHYDNWHDDAEGHRVVTMSLNLSTKVFDGGALQMKRRGSDEILREVRNTGLGDALLFRISDGLVHRVQAVQGDVPKTAFAGWFLWGKEFHSDMRKIANCSAQMLPNDQPDWEVPVLDEPE